MAVVRASDFLSDKLLASAVCTIVSLITLYAFWRLRAYQFACTRGDKIETALLIKNIALKPSGWGQIRERAFKVLRLVELPPKDIEDLENLTKNEKNQDFQSELEHTVYELQTRAREKDREGKLLNKKTARNLANQGLDHRRMKRYQEAIAAFDRAISINEKDVEFITERGITYRQMRRYQEALDDFTRAIHIDEKYIDAIAERILTYQQMQRYQEALDDLVRIITLDKKHVGAIFYQGIIYRQMGRYKDALAHFDRALALNEKGDGIIAQRGMTYLLTARHQEALADFNRAIALNDEYYWYRYCRALVYLLTGRTNAFTSELNRAIDLAQADLDKRTEDLRTSLSFDLALFSLVGGNTANAELQYSQLAATCPSWSLLQTAVDDLTDFLLVQPSNQLAQRIRAQLETRLVELKEAPVQ